MPDPTPTPMPTPAPKASRSRGEINQALLDTLARAEEIAAVAKKPAYAALLAGGGVNATKVAALISAIAAARLLASAAVQGTVGRQGMTQDETDLMDTLIHQIQTIQKRARQKYDATEPVRLKDYAVGQQFYNSRSLLEQAAANILTRLQTDTLPGIDAAKVAALQAALADYQGVQGDQSGAQSAATTARKQFETSVASIVAMRREIQFAADADWPHTDPTNAGIRAEFQLPPDRVMK